MYPALRRITAALAAVAIIVAMACGSGDQRPEPQAQVVFLDTPAPAPAETPAPISTPSPTPTPTAAPTPSPPPTPSPEPTPAPTATPTVPPTPRPVEVRSGVGYVIGDSVVVRSAPSTQSGGVVRRLQNLEEVAVVGAVAGEQWIVGDQRWPMAPHSWTRTWYQVEDGYIYSAFVWLPDPNAASPFVRTAGERVINVSLSTQRLNASVGGQVIYTAKVTTGKPTFETPPGAYQLWPVGRRLNETMTSTLAGISDPAEEYHVKNVLYTQYFTADGFALHLNYWQPESVFGVQPTSHGCVGLLLQDAQWLWLFVQPGTRLVIRA